MYCPEHLVMKAGRVYVWLYWRDVPRETIPLRIWLNPFRYEISVRYGKNSVLKINREGQWLRNRIYRIKQAVKRAFDA
jgi:hypothetical protein